MTIGINRSAAREHRAHGSNDERGTSGTNWAVCIAALLVVLVVPINAWTATSSKGSSEGDARETDERALLNWATHLSRYSTDQNLPQIRYESREFFNENACLGREDCRVLGWYDDRDIVYIDESLGAMDSLFERSLLVHEFVHVLQHRSGDFDEHDCMHFVEREREAYGVQQAFFVAHGAVPAMRTRQYSCKNTTPGPNAEVNELDDAYARQAFVNSSDPLEAGSDQ